MEIIVREAEPFEVDEKAFRQVKARDGEEEGGWRLDLILSKASNKRVTGVSFSVRYFNESGDFLGLDTPYCHFNDGNDFRDVSLYVEPPKGATKAELRILSKSDVIKYLLDDSKWGAVILFFAILSIAIIVAALRD